METFKENDLAALRARAHQIGLRHHFEETHAHQVTRLALMLFDQLTGVHGLASQDRAWLEMAGLLHDTGWINGQKKHHKSSLEIILRSDLPLPKEKLILVGLVARYHRKALPNDTHDYYKDLTPASKQKIRRLAALLRLADGLDNTHTDAVKDFLCLVKKDSVVIRLRATTDLSLEIRSAQNKKDLFELEFGRKLNFIAERLTNKNNRA